MPTPYSQNDDADPERSSGAKADTLVFCTSYCISHAMWSTRIRRWIDAIKVSKLRFTQALIVDDGSPILPTWPDVVVVHEGDRIPAEASIVIYHFKKNLGRLAVLDFPGWYRSFAFPAVYDGYSDFVKLIHIESDAFLITDRIIDYFNEVEDDWISLYSNQHSFPEIAIQIISGSYVQSYREFVTKDFSRLIGEELERRMPINNVEKQFEGDRYGEFMAEVPRSADWATQTKSEAPPEYFWWLAQNDTVLKFGKNDNGVSALRDGWSDAEADFTWSDGRRSTISLKKPFMMTDHSLRISLMPCLIGQTIPFQRLEIFVNDAITARLVVRGSEILDLWIPYNVIAEGDNVEVRFEQVDAFSPSSLLKAASDDRVLGFAVRQIWLTPIGDSAERANAAGSASAPI